MNWAAIIWLMLMVLFIMAESSTVSMVSLWFAVGALVALVVSLLGGAVWLQCVVFFVVAAVLLALLRPVAKKYFTPKLTKTNVDAIVGQTGIVCAAIDNRENRGQVKLNGMDWTARSESGEAIDEGTYVKVVRVAGVKVFVSVVEEKVTV